MQCIAARSNVQFEMMGKVNVKVNTLVNSVGNRLDMICVVNTRFEHWICSNGSTDKHTRSVLFGKAARLNLQFDMLHLNTGFALVVRMINTAR